ncbi:MAG: apolipoprotein N-acyltransferase [Candidatus Baltobacteraceae bacterium]
MSASAHTTSIRFRTIATSVRATELLVCLFGAIALAFALPKAGQAWLAPLGAAALFWAWQRLSYKRAFFAGWFAGAVYFGIGYSWITYTVGSYVGIFAFAIVVIPAAVHALTFAFTALATRLAARHAPAWLVPLAFAAAFTVFEWWRSIGVIGIPFAQVGYSQTGTLLGVYAAYAGAFGVTFAVMGIGAYAAYAIASRTVRALAAAAAVLAASWSLCFLFWPARHAAPPRMRVAVVQGNIPQSLKAENLDLAVSRYTAMTLRLEALRPALIVWPETVILTELNESPAYFDWQAGTPQQRARMQSLIAADRSLFGRFGQLAVRVRSTLMVGSLDRHYGPEGLKSYNAVYTYAPSGVLQDVYDKRQLVPFAESLPAPALFSHLPYADLIGRYGHGTDDTVITVDGMRFAPLICWESAFADIVHARLQKGAQVLVIPTDDAWFGPSSGTYQHAQIAQMRAIESGEWVVQAASTGVSGIISPAGRWTESSPVGKQTVVVGNVGQPTGSVFARIGPTPVGVAMMLLYAAIAGLSALRARIRNA